MAAPKPELDWLAIEGEYRAGLESVNAIAAKYGVAEASIRFRAKNRGWVRDPTGTKRKIVNYRMAGVSNEVAQDVTRRIEAEAELDIQDMQRGLRISRMCLVNLEASAEGETNPKVIKTVVEATSAAIDLIRKIRGLDESPNAKDEVARLKDMTDDELKAELEKYGIQKETAS